MGWGWRGGQSKAALSSHSSPRSSGLGDLGVGGLVKRAFFICLFSAFLLPVSLPRFLTAAGRGFLPLPIARPQARAALGPVCTRHMHLVPGLCCCRCCSFCQRLRGLLSILPAQGAGRPWRQRGGAVVSAGASCLFKGLFIRGTKWQGSGVRLLLESLLGACGHRAKACSLEEMFNKDTGVSNCLFILTERWRYDVPGNCLRSGLQGCKARG